MMDLIWFIMRKTFKVVFILLFSMSLYNCFKTPGGYSEKMLGAFQKTRLQSEEVVQELKDAMLGKVRMITGDMNRFAQMRKMTPERDKEEIAEDRARDPADLRKTDWKAM
ncbi:MAG: hypothetical protein ACE14T_01695 [Syntrophales bacterium]